MSLNRPYGPWPSDDPYWENEDPTEPHGQYVPPPADPEASHRDGRHLEPHPDCPLCAAETADEDSDEYLWAVISDAG